MRLFLDSSVLIAAAVSAEGATADVLLTLDRGDFDRLLGTRFYGLAIMTPGMWLTQERDPGRQGAS